MVVCVDVKTTVAATAAPITQRLKTHHVLALMFAFGSFVRIGYFERQIIVVKKIDTRGICHSCSSLFWAIYLYSSSLPEVALKWDESQNKNDPLIL